MLGHIPKALQILADTSSILAPSRWIPFLLPHN